DQNDIRRHVNVFVDGENVRYTQGAVTPVSNDAEIWIYPALSGGSQNSGAAYVRDKNMNTANADPIGPSDRVLVIERIFDAPRDLVFKAWTEPERQAQWLGPRGFTTISCEMDARPGGDYRFHMRSPQGVDLWIRGVHREVVAPRLLVRTFSWRDSEGNLIRPPETILTVTLEEYRGKTKLTLHQATFASAADRDDHNQGWNSSLDSLSEYLATA
ncbi:MAG TPA: SRPBCC domain-containing protein, partial [Candidatus Kryptonia bacterium]|nr:SRPBCC domain-containing protein [Candidatus Kryptonia bacterium]